MKNFEVRFKELKKVNDKRKSLLYDLFDAGYSSVLIGKKYDDFVISNITKSGNDYLFTAKIDGLPFFLDNIDSSIFDEMIEFMMENLKPEDTDTSAKRKKQFRFIRSVIAKYGSIELPTDTEPSKVGLSPVIFKTVDKIRYYIVDVYSDSVLVLGYENDNDDVFDEMDIKLSTLDDKILTELFIQVGIYNSYKIKNKS